MISLLYRPRLPRRKFYYLVGAASTILLTLAVWLSSLVSPAGPYVVLGTALASLAYANLIERHWVEVTRRELVIPHLPPDMDGFRIVHLTDLHWSRRANVEWMSGVVRQANLLHPDMVVVTGDIITRGPDLAESCALVLGQLRARYGRFAVLGNHDHWAGGPQLTRALESQGWQVLFNQHVFIPHPWDDAQGFWLVGVDDPHLRRDDLTQALRGLPDDGRPRVLLAHSPDIVEEAAGKVDLVLSGHTHGGQCRLPLVGSLLRATRRPFAAAYAIGWHQAGTTWCLTNRGIGVSLLPLRFNCRPEMAVVTLRSGS